MFGKTEWVRLRLATKFCLILWFAYTVHAFAADKPLQLRVLSYNIHHGRGADDKVDLQRIAGVINEARPDLVALQEVDSGVKRSASIGEPRHDKIITSHAEVLNRQVRQSCGRRFQRLTNAHSKSLRHHAAMTTIFVCWYNFVRSHETIKKNASDGGRLDEQAVDDSRDVGAGSGGLVRDV